MDLQGKVAIITGSSVGVGKATAIQFASRGCSVVINYIHGASEAEETARQCRERGAAAFVQQADVSRDAECCRLILESANHFGRLDYLVNNAGTTSFVNFDDLEGLTEEIWEQTYRTNVMGSFFNIRAAVPTMKLGGGGSIVNVASLAGILPLGSSIAYAASKAALIHMTKALAKVLGPSIRVNAVAPGAIDTRWLRDGLGKDGFASLRSNLRETTPLQEVSRPEDVADAILWLATSGRMVTGDTIIVDGGFHLGKERGLPPK